MRYALFLILFTIFLLSGCRGTDYAYKYNKLIDTMHMNEWNISSVTDGKLMVWLMKDRAKELLYGTEIEGETNGTLYLRRDIFNNQLEIIHISDQRASSATHPYPFSPSHRAYKVDVWRNKGNLLASDYEGRVTIFCDLTSYRSLK
jgi:hypothetical protein